MRFLDQLTRNLFFTGKGGVGKTSLARAAAIRQVDAGRTVLLVSTDPASNLDEVLGTPLGQHPTLVPAVPGLSAMNLDPEKSAAEYRERMVGPYRTLLPAAAIASMEEQFSGSCTLEIAAFEEFFRLLGDASATAAFDHVIFDTARTGHTLRLLTLPSAWSGFMEQNTTGTSCLGSLAGLQSQQLLYHDTVSALGDGVITTLVLVTRPEVTALREAARTSGELAALGVQNQHLVVNGVIQASDAADRWAVALQKRGEAALPESVAQLLPRLRDPNFSRVLIVTSPEATPVHEAAQLQRDLRRAEIEPYAWVINQSLFPFGVTDPVLRGRQSHEAQFIREVVDELAQCTALIPWQIDPPVGYQAIKRLVGAIVETGSPVGSPV